RPFLLLVFDLQDGQEGFLRDLDAADLLHALLAGLLFFEQFFLAGVVAAITFGMFVLAQRLDVFEHNDLVGDSRLVGYVEHLASKASCGISTLPTCFMRFLPAFCFSSSFFLREMSPP